MSDGEKYFKAQKEKEHREDEFFKSIPSKVLLEEMRKIVAHTISFANTFGEDITTTQYRNELPYRASEWLKHEEIDGWVDMRPKHSQRHNYRMFKSLCDLCKSELKLKIDKIETKSTGELLTKNLKRMTRQKKNAKSTGELLTKNSKPMKAKSRSKKKATDEPQASQNTEDIKAEIRECEQKLGKQTRLDYEMDSHEKQPPTDSPSVTEIMTQLQAQAEIKEHTSELVNKDDSALREEPKKVIAGQDMEAEENG